MAHNVQVKRIVYHVYKSYTRNSWANHGFEWNLTEGAQGRMDKGDIYPEEGPLRETEIIFLLAKKEDKGCYRWGTKFVSGGEKSQKKDE